MDNIVYLPEISICSKEILHKAFFKAKKKSNIENNGEMS